MDNPTIHKNQENALTHRTYLYIPLLILELAPAHFKDFPEWTKILKARLRKLKHSRNELEPMCKYQFEQSLEGIAMSDQSKMHKDLLWNPMAYSFFYEFPLSHYDVEIAMIEKILKRASFANFKKGEFNDNNIAIAKQAELSKLYKPNGAGFISCPFHREKTASCHLNGNRFHCFGCKKDGDAIDMVMEREKLDFIGAVLYLNQVR